MVTLAENYTLEQHISRVPGEHGGAAVDSVVDFGGQILYSAELSSDAFAAVRADIGVDAVECDQVPLLSQLRSSA